MTRIKCCGMTRVEDALLAARLGVDAIGLVFTARSMRRISLQQGHAIVRALPPFVSTVALFMDDAPDFIREVIDMVAPDLLQFHGDETDEECAFYHRPYLKAVALGDGKAALSRLDEYPQASGLLLDAHRTGEVGGTGARFDWSMLPHALSQPIVLAGGLRPQNVAVAIRQLRPWAVDVSSGVESAPGIKDAERLAAFVRAVRAAQ